MGYKALRLLGALGMIIAGLMAAGCGSDNDAGGGSASGEGGSGPAKAPEVAMIAYAILDFAQAEVPAMEAELESVGGSMKVFNANFDPQKQLQQCTDAITSGRYNVIVLMPVDGAAVAPCVTQAKEADVPVVAFENPAGPDRNKIEPQLDGVVGSVVYTGARGGELAADLMTSACEGVDPCNVIIEIALKADPFSAVRLKALEDAAESTQSIKILQVYEGNYDPTQTAKKLPDVLGAHPDVNVVVFEADNNAIEGLKAIEAAGLTDVKSIGDGGGRQGAAAVAEGRLYGTTGTWPAQSARIAAKMVIDAVNGKKIAQPAVDFYDVDTPAVITKDNVGDFTAEWGAGK